MTTPITTLTLDEARAVLEAQPFSRLVGARITEFEPGRATLELDVAEHHRQQFGLVHGGVIAYLVDNVLAFAAGSVLGPAVVSTGYSASLVGNVRDGLLRAVANVVHAGSDQAVCSIEVVGVRADGTTKVCALAQGEAVSTRRGAGS